MSATSVSPFGNESVRKKSSTSFSTHSSIGLGHAQAIVALLAEALARCEQVNTARADALAERLSLAVVEAELLDAAVIRRSQPSVVADRG